MALFSGVTQNISQALDRLSVRERRLLALAGAGLVLFVGTIVLGSYNSAMTRAETAVEEKDGQLRQVAVYAQTYAQNERARRDMESKLGSAPMRLLSQLQELCDKHGLVIGSMNDRGETVTGQVRESLVELQVGAASLDKLVRLLNDLEANPRVVKLKKLRIRSAGTNPAGGDDKNLNVTLTVAAYSLAAKG